MNPATWLSNRTKTWMKRLAVPVLAGALAASFATYELKPASASAVITPAPAASPLDDNSVGALLSLDKAMETLAARVMPAVVNVTVTSRVKPDEQSQQMQDQMQQFFGEQGPFGQFGPQMGPHMRGQRQPQIE